MIFALPDAWRRMVAASRRLLARANSKLAGFMIAAPALVRTDA
jgi:hypothetical protein